MSMREEVKELITAVGAMAEYMALLRDELMKNGYTRKEAVELTKAYLLEFAKPNNDDKENN